MENTIPTYQVEIVDKSFSLKERVCEKTVIVKTFIGNKILTSKKYGLVAKEEIYNLLKQGKSINLSECYVKDFSVNEYKKNNKLEKVNTLEINDFLAENAFFDHLHQTDFSYVNFKGIVKFNGATFSDGNISFYHSQFSNPSDTEFIETEFGNGEINFQYTQFSDERVLFSSSKFYGGTVSFVNSNFKSSDVLFNHVNFYNCKVIFDYAKFGDGNINFQKSKFGNRAVDFKRIEFGSGRVDFSRTLFGDCSVTFDGSELKDGRFNFRSTKFGNGVNSFKQMNFGEAEVLFEKADFGAGEVSFSESIASMISFKGSRISVFLDLNVSKAKVIDLSETILRDIINIRFVNQNVNIKTLYLNEIRNLGKIIIDWKKNHVEKLIKSQTKTTLRQKAEQFNTLKENFHSNGQYEDEDKAYVQFKRFELVADYKEALQQGEKNILKLPGFLFEWIIFDKMGLYATSPLRVLFSTFIIYILFSLAYLIMPIIGAGNIINSVGATDGLSYLQTCFYHSAITFLTIGYGDYYPTGFSRAISITEGWTGLFLMSYFTVAFVRKILR